MAQQRTRRGRRPCLHQRQPRSPLPTGRKLSWTPVQLFGWRPGQDVSDVPTATGRRGDRGEARVPVGDPGGAAKKCSGGKTLAPRSARGQGPGASGPHTPWWEKYKRKEGRPSNRCHGQGAEWPRGRTSMLHTTVSRFQSTKIAAWGVFMKEKVIGRAGSVRYLHHGRVSGSARSAKDLIALFAHASGG